MPAPVSKLDQRYSGPAVTATSWEETQRYAARDGAFRDAGSGEGEVMVFSVTPAKVFAHAKGDPFGATTHRFPREE